MPVKPPSPPYVGPAAHDSGPGNPPIHRCVIHSTVGPTREGQARNVAAWFRNPAAGGSAHYVTDPAESVQVVYDSRVAWHAPPNDNSLGFELCDWPGASEREKAPVRRWRRDEHARMLRRASRLVARACLAYDVPIRHIGPVGLRLGRKGVCGHIDVSRAWGESSHWDPGRFPWRRFIRMCRRAAIDIQGGRPEPEPDVPQPEPDEPTPPNHDNRMTRIRDDLQGAARLARKRDNKARRVRILEALRILPER